jgi:hypothetical protein
MSDSLSGLRPVEALGVDARAAFITRTYWNLFGAVVAFTLLEVFYFKTGLAERMAQVMLSGSWLIVLGGFMIVGWLANSVAGRARSLGAQYAALLGFVLAESIIFVPMLFIAQVQAPGVIQSAAVMTLLGFTGLTGTVFITRKDFSFLRAVLMWGGIGALLLIVGAAIFGLQLGTFFSVAMIVFAGAAILYDTSNVLHRFPEDRYVAAALSLFASVALLFWYVLRLFMGNRR